MSLSGKVVKIPPLVSWKECCSMQDHCTTDSSVLYLCKKLRLSVPAIRVIGQPSVMSGTDLAANRVISRMFSSFKRNYLSR